MFMGFLPYSLPEFWELTVFWTSAPLLLLTLFMAVAIALHIHVHDPAHEVGGSGWMRTVSNSLAPFVTHQLRVLVAGIIISLVFGLLISSISSHDNPAEHMPLAGRADDVKSTSRPLLGHGDESGTPDTPRDPIPRTPQDLLALYQAETWRDVMRYKGMWMSVEGTVRDIGEVIRRQADPTRTPVIQVTLSIGPLPHDARSSRIEMFVNAEQWESIVDQIRRGDWVVARGIVDHVSSRFVGLIEGEIISVSGRDKNRKTN